MVKKERVEACATTIFLQRRALRGDCTGLYAAETSVGIEHDDVRRPPCSERVSSAPDVTRILGRGILVRGVVGGDCEDESGRLDPHCQVSWVHGKNPGVVRLEVQLAPLGILAVRLFKLSHISHP